MLIQLLQSFCGRYQVMVERVNENGAFPKVDAVANGLSRNA